MFLYNEVIIWKVPSRIRAYLIQSFIQLTFIINCYQLTFNIYSKPEGNSLYNSGQTEKKQVNKVSSDSDCNVL